VLQVARIILFLFAVLMIAGGFAGYEEKKSIISLIAGVVCGGLALAGGILLTTNPKIALALGLAGAILGLGGMLPRVLKSEKPIEQRIWPGITVVVASALTAIVSGATLATLKNIPR
jgi:uncharacterized membrane protein (UPF0136 family)